MENEIIPKVSQLLTQFVAQFYENARSQKMAPAQLQASMKIFADFKKFLLEKTGSRYNPIHEQVTIDDSSYPSLEELTVETGFDINPDEYLKP